MEDLLTEEDFLNKPLKNPWKYFWKFYLGSVLYMAAVFTISKSVNEESLTGVIVISTFIMPLIISILMMYGRRTNFLYPRNVILTALLLLHGVYFGCMAIFGIIDIATKGYDYDFPLVISIIFVMYAILYVISITVILPIAKRKKRKAGYLIM